MTKRIKVEASEMVYYQFEMEVPDDAEEGQALDELVNDHWCEMTPDQREEANTTGEDWQFNIEFMDEDEEDDE